MNQKKNKKILMILIIIVLIIIIISGIILVFATDIFKSDKDLFFKYITQMGDSKQGFIESSLLQYFEKLTTTPYNDEGNISFDINSNQSISQKQTDLIKKFNVSFSGQVDTPNSKAYQEISLNYSDDVKFLINYKQIENTIGLQTDYVGKNFIAVETDKLDNLFQNTSANSMQIDTENLDITKQLEDLKLTEEEINHITNTYKDIFTQQLGNEKFSKITESDETGYKLSLTVEDIQNLFKSILETLKDDDITLDKLNQYIEKLNGSSSKITKRDIEDFIKDLDNSDSSEVNQNIEITVYTKNGKTNKIILSIQDMFTIEIKKDKNQDNLQYQIILNVNDESDIALKISLEANYQGLSTLQNIKQSYVFKLEEMEEENSIQYKFDNSINFTDSVNIEDFTDENSTILTNYEYDQVSNFLGAVTQRISQVNKQQMEELGLSENANPINYIIPSLGTYPQSYSSLNQMSSQMDELEVSTFNAVYEKYASTNQNGAAVKGMLSQMVANNEEDNKLKIEEINFNGEEYEATQENITFIKTDVDVQKNYRVEFEKDSNTGAIYRAVINER